MYVTGMVTRCEPEGKSDLWWGRVHHRPQRQATGMAGRRGPRAGLVFGGATGISSKPSRGGRVSEGGAVAFQPIDERGLSSGCSSGSEHGNKAGHWGRRRGDLAGSGPCNLLVFDGLQKLSGGEAGIRTLGRGLCPFNGLANRRLQPLGHLTASAVREPAGAGRNTDYIPMSPVVRPPRSGRAPGTPRIVTRSPRGPPAAPTGTRAAPPP